MKYFLHKVKNPTFRTVLGQTHLHPSPFLVTSFTSAILWYVICISYCVPTTQSQISFCHHALYRGVQSAVRGPHAAQDGCECSPSQNCNLLKTLWDFLWLRVAMYLICGPRQFFLFQCGQNVGHPCDPLPLHYPSNCPFPLVTTVLSGPWVFVCLFVLFVHLLLSVLHPTCKWNHVVLDFFCLTYFA